MKQNNIKEPIGLDAVVSAVKTTIEKAQIYHYCGLKPPHYIINLDEGNGQTTVTKYVTDSFANFKIRHYGGRDMYLEYALDGSMEQLKTIFANIRACSVYTNEFEGVVAIDIGKLADHINERQVDVFIDGITKVSKSATLIFYISSKMNKSTTTLVGKICSAIDGINMVHIEPYTPENLLEITKFLIDSAGVVVDTEVDKIIFKTIVNEHITNVTMVKKLCDKVIKNANFDAFIPKVGLREIANILEYDVDKRRE